MRILSLDGDVLLEGTDNDFVMKEGAPVFHPNVVTRPGAIVQLWDWNPVVTEPAPEGMFIMDGPPDHKVWLVGEDGSTLEPLDEDQPS